MFDIQEELKKLPDPPEIRCITDCSLYIDGLMSSSHLIKKYS